MNLNFPHIMLSSTAGKSCSSCCLKENFYQRKFFIFLWKSSYLRRSSKNLQSSKIFEEILNWRRFFVFVFGLFSETEESSYSSSVHFQSSLQHWYWLSKRILGNQQVFLWTEGIFMTQLCVLFMAFRLFVEG